MEQLKNVRFYRHVIKNVQAAGYETISACVRVEYGERKHSLYDVALLCGVTPPTVRNWLVKLGIPIRPPGGHREKAAVTAGKTKSKPCRHCGQLFDFPADQPESWFLWCKNCSKVVDSTAGDYHGSIGLRRVYG